MSATSKVTVPLLQRHLKATVDFLKPFLPIVDSHMTQFFTERLWHKHIPPDIQREAHTESEVREALDIYRNHLRLDADSSDIPARTDRFKHLRTLLTNTKHYYLDRFRDVWITPDELAGTLAGTTETRQSIHSRFMPEKKQHEVEIVGRIIASMCALNQNEGNLCVIDAGDGKGYLSTHLSVDYGLKVLGVDYESSRSSGALARHKQFSNYLKTKERSHCHITAEQYTSLLDANYRNTTQLITPQTDFRKMFNESFGPAPAPVGLCLTGLHTCGDLASTCLRIFCESDQVAAICNIGCCYHKNTERFNDTHQFNHNPCLKAGRDAIGYGFPLSQYMLEHPIGFGSTARQVSVDSIHRGVRIADDHKRFRSLFHRALLEVLIHRHRPQFYGRTATGSIKQADFVEYVRQANDRKPDLEFGEQHISDNELVGVYEEFREQLPLLILYSLLRNSLGSLIETIFTLDRLLYLKENERSSHDLSCLIRVFDPVISPRCYGLVAIKNFHKFQ